MKGKFGLGIDEEQNRPLREFTSPDCDFCCFIKSSISALAKASKSRVFFFLTFLVRTGAGTWRVGAGIVSECALYGGDGPSG